MTSWATSSRDVRLCYTSPSGALLWAPIIERGYAAAGFCAGCRFALAPCGHRQWARAGDVIGSGKVLHGMVCAGADSALGNPFVKRSIAHHRPSGLPVPLAHRVALH